jgi:deazaflavin-dependent oxidoreductase (nitroreductase family)
VRKNPVVRIVEGERYVAVATTGGARRNPSWYANLVAHPTVRLQDGAAIKRLRAREVFGDVDTTAAELFAVIAQGVLTAQTDHVLPLKDAADAHRALEGRRTTGATVFIP